MYPYPSPPIGYISDRNYSTHEIVRIIADNALYRYQRDDTHTYKEQMVMTQKIILADTPTYRKSLIKRATDPNYQFASGEREMLQIIYEELE